MNETLTEKWYNDCLAYDIPVSPSDVKDIVEELLELKKEKENNNMIKTWDELTEKHGNFDREKEMNKEKEREYVKDLFSVYENEGFNKVFWSPSMNIGEEKYFGKPFKVLGRTPETRNNLSLLPLWDIEFEDGKQLTVEAFEIITVEMRAHNCPNEYLIKAEDNNNEEQEDLNCLYARLIMKLHCELFSYKEKLYRMIVDEVIEEAYKLTMLKEFVKIFETQSKENLNSKQFNFFLRMDNALEYLYEVWLAEDTNEREIYADFLFKDWNWEM